MGTVISVIVVLGIIFGVAFIRSYITRRGNEARAERERIAAANYLRATPLPQPPGPAVLPASPVTGARYAADDPPPPPPPGW